MRIQKDRDLGAVFQTLMWCEQIVQPGLREHIWMNIYISHGDFWWMNLNLGPTGPWILNAGPDSGVLKPSKLSSTRMWCGRYFVDCHSFSICTHLYSTDICQVLTFTPKYRNEKKCIKIQGNVSMWLMK